MTVYMIADMKVTNDSWIPAYAAEVHHLVHKYGGRYLARSANVRTLEGEPLETTVIAVIAFPSASAVESFLADPKYQPFGEARKAGTVSRFQLIDDTDVAGTIPYLRRAGDAGAADGEQRRKAG